MMSCVEPDADGGVFLRQPARFVGHGEAREFMLSPQLATAAMNSPQHVSNPPKNGRYGSTTPHRSDASSVRFVGNGV